MSESSSFDLSQELKNLMMGNDTINDGEIEHSTIRGSIMPDLSRSLIDRTPDISRLDDDNVNQGLKSDTKSMQLKLESISRELSTLKSELKSINTPHKAQQSPTDSNKDLVQLDRQELREMVRLEVKLWVENELEGMISKIVKEEVGRELVNIKQSLLKASISHQQNRSSLNRSTNSTKSPCRTQELGKSTINSKHPKLKKIQLQDYQTEILLRKLDEKFRAKQVSGKRPAFK